MDEYIIILRTIIEHPESTQRDFAKALGVSLGKTNQLVSTCIKAGFMIKQTENARYTKPDSGEVQVSVDTGIYKVTKEGQSLLDKNRVDAALILASGFGSRFVPLTYEMPKGLLEVFGERMIERQIRQLHERGITDITIMVGYLKEKFDYLIDKYDVKLLYNPEYSGKNTLATMYHASDVLKDKNCYILSSDNWMRENMYHTYEPHTWYAAAFMKGETSEWAMSFGKNGKIKDVQVGGSDCYCMYGPVYFTKKFSEAFLPVLMSYYRMPGTQQFYWEDVLVRNLKRLPDIYVNCQPDDEIYEFENLEELRAFDEKYIHNSGSSAMRLVADIFHISEADIVNIKCLKAGMTNKSWLFEVKDAKHVPDKYRGKSYICRIPGPGTQVLINRKQESDVYKEVSRLGVTEELVYFDSENGYKISRYYSGARNADFKDATELSECMVLLKKLHNSKMVLDHDFDIRERLGYYEELIKNCGKPIPFEDYELIKGRAIQVLDWLSSLDRPKTICHIDSVEDNFIFTSEGLKMIDWEYSGMADPLTDLGMAAIYSYMNFDDARKLLETYKNADESTFINKSNNDTKPHVSDANVSASDVCQGGGVAISGYSKELCFDIVVAYMGLGGLLWSLWGVYKSALGEEFGDYTLKMYRYFKNSYQFLQKIL